MKPREERDSLFTEQFHSSRIKHPSIVASCNENSIIYQQKSATAKMDAKSGSDSDDSLFGTSSSPQPDKKRRKLNDNQTDNNEREKRPDGKGFANNQKSTSSGSGSGTVVDPALMQHAKRRLSKFAARLFDPNRKKVSVCARMIESITVPMSSRLACDRAMQCNAMLLSQCFAVALCCCK